MVAPSPVVIATDAGGLEEIVIDNRVGSGRSDGHENLTPGTRMVLRLSPRIPPGQPVHLFDSRSQPSCSEGNRHHVIRAGPAARPARCLGHGMSHAVNVQALLAPPAAR